MKALIDIVTQRTARVFLVGAEFKKRSAFDVQESLAELAELATTAGATVMGRGTQRLEAPASATYIGRGKAADFARECKALKVDTVIFDDDLGPAQARNLEKIFDCKIMDRTTLILDIFARRAQTREGKLQVELAQLEYLLPRLTRYWGHLSRQAGGIGIRGGEGESQLEADRRRVQERIDRIREDMKAVRRQRTTRRASRQRSHWPLASIVGYTNAGKSTLLNALTGSSVLVEDKLFATLDPTTRRLRLPTNQNVLLSDTVGFIRKLPHKLVAAFKATLEEVVTADLLVHVVDASHPHARERIQAVNEVLEEIGAAGKPTLIVLNKIDCLADRNVLGIFHDEYPNAAVISAVTGEGIPELLAELGQQLRPVRDYLELSIPHGEAGIISRLHEVAQITERRYQNGVALFKARIPPHYRHEFRAYIRRELQPVAASSE